MEKIGILGSGNVGQTLAFGFLKSGYKVKVGTRNPSKLEEWLKKSGENASVGSFKEAAEFGDIVVLCIKGTEVLNAIKLAGKKAFSKKTVIDVTNPLVFESEGKPPKLALGYPNSLGQSIQKALPDANVVKAFNIVRADYMINPGQLKGGVPDMFIAGNDKDSKKAVTAIAESWGWPVIDLGGIDNAYLLEALSNIWITYGFLNNHWSHAFKLLKE